MKYLIVILFLFFLAPSCETKTKKIKSPSKEGLSITPIDSSKNLLIHSKDFTGGVIMDKSVEGDLNSFTPTTEEIVQAEEIFKKCLYVDKVGSDGIEISHKNIRPPKDYIRQYFGRINDNGQKTIRFNCFWRRIEHYLEDERWKYKEFSREDGGNDFFQILINLETKDCSYFIVNSNG